MKQLQNEYNTRYIIVSLYSKTFDTRSLFSEDSLLNPNTFSENMRCPFFPL